MFKRILTNKIFVIGVAAILVVSSLIMASITKEPELFGASGALLVIAGAILATRRLIRLGYIDFVEDKRIVDGGSFSPTEQELEADRQFDLDERSFYWSVPVSISGTLIWAYGSLLCGYTFSAV